ncbi:LtrC [Oenococcus sp. UCMA 17063]|nr:LtrC [Oenococcus sp. UCMA 17063]
MERKKQFKEFVKQNREVKQPAPNPDQGLKR